MAVILAYGSPALGHLYPMAALLAEIKTYAEFPKSEEWLRKALEKLLRAEAPGAKR